MNKNTLKIGIDEAMEVLQALDKPFEEIYYENECLSDFRKKPYETMIFCRKFVVRKSGGGRYSVLIGRVVEEFKANSHKEMDRKVYEFAEKCEAMVPEHEAANRNWIPEKWKNIKNAIKIFNLAAKK